MTAQSKSQSEEKSQTASWQRIMESQHRARQETLSQKVNEMGFIEKGTGKHQSNTIYSENGVSPCLNSVNYKEPLKVLIDTSMSGLEGGAVRTYKDTAPSITAREYKDPRMIMEQANGKTN